MDELSFIFEPEFFRLVSLLFAFFFFFGILGSKGKGRVKNAFIYSLMCLLIIAFLVTLFLTIFAFDVKLLLLLAVIVVLFNFIGGFLDELRISNDEDVGIWSSELDMINREETDPWEKENGNAWEKQQLEEEWSSEDDQIKEKVVFKERVVTKEKIVHHHHYIEKEVKPENFECPGCGVLVSSKQSRCEYCKAPLD